MKSYKYILLDWDGNLAKTLDLWLRVFRTVLDEEGYHPTDEEIAASFGKVEDFFSALGIKNPKVIYEKADVLGKKALPDVELYPEALEVLNKLKELGKKTALITTSAKVNIEHLLDKYDMHPLFDVVITREDTSSHKPHPEPLIKALTMLKGNIAEAVMIGDSDKDLGAALNAGVDSILFYPEEHKKFYNIDALMSHRPTYIVENFKDILGIVSVEHSNIEEV